MKLRRSCLGSARASRAGDGALAIANFSKGTGTNLAGDKVHCGEAPHSAREARALPGTRTKQLKLIMICCAFAILGCETTNYAPPVTPALTKSTSRDIPKLERGRNLFVHRCIECHTLPAMWKYSRKDWPKIVNDMSHRASLKPQDREAVISYILAVRKAM